MKPEKYAAEALQLVETVSEALTKKNKMKVPISSTGYKGFLLLHSVKGAAVLGFERGHGIAFKTTETLPDGSLRLSPPVLVKTAKVAVGLQLGYSSVYSILMLPDEAQLEALVHESETIIGKDFEVSGYPGVNSDNISTFHKTSMSAISDGVHINPAVISVSDSLMVCDISLYGGTINVDREAMVAAYGESYCGPVEVLRGKVELPAVMKEQYDKVQAAFNQLSKIHAV